MLIWSTKDFDQQTHKSVRGNIEFDYAEHVCWSPDTKAFIIHKSAGNAIEVYKVTKRPDGSVGNAQVALTFPQVCFLCSSAMHLFRFASPSYSFVLLLAFIIICKFSLILVLKYTTYRVKGLTLKRWG